MATLHLVSQAASLVSAISVAHSADTIVLLEDGVYAATDLAALKPNCAVVLLAPDLTIRGVNHSNQAARISYDELVELCTQHSPITTWS